MKRYIAGLLLLSGVLSLPAFAGDAKQLSAEESVEINAKLDDVWTKVSNFNDLGAWHPVVKKTEIVKGTNNEKGAVRLLTLQDNGTI